jgi:hypothetical protein
MAAQQTFVKTATVDTERVTLCVGGKAYFLKNLVEHLATVFGFTESFFLLRGGRSLGREPATGLMSGHHMLLPHVLSPNSSSLISNKQSTIALRREIIFGLLMKSLE